MNSEQKQLLKQKLAEKRARLQAEIVKQEKLRVECESPKKLYEMYAYWDTLVQQSEAIKRLITKLNKGQVILPEWARCVLALKWDKKLHSKLVRLSTIKTKNMKSRERIAAKKEKDD
jgi:hypothetical protein